MNRTTKLVALAVALLLTGVLIHRYGPGPKPAPEPGTGPAGSSVLVLSVADGDTFTARTETGERVRVRLLGIDAPEVAHNRKPADCGANAATDALSQLIEGRTVRLIEDPVADSEDRYQRQLRYLEMDGNDVGLLLVEQGLVGAWHPATEPEPTRYASYAAAQQTARAERTGQWDRCTRLGR